jgi:four helix bundle protein
MDIEKLQVWQKAMELANKTYVWTRDFPTQEQYGLISQMRRAAVSIPSNIAEGSQRTTDRDFANFILIARGSLAELKTQILISHRLDFLSDAVREEAVSNIEELSKMLFSFHATLTQRS